MRLGALFSGGKDSAFAAYLAKKYGYKVACLISIESRDRFSYMFHTPSISKVEKQAEVMRIPLIKQETMGRKEAELKDLEKAIVKAKKKHLIKGIVTGAIESVYQAVRIQKICNKLGLEVFNPLWQKDQVELLKEMVSNKFEVIITGVAAYPLDRSWLGRKIDRKFITDAIELNRKYKISPAGEGGEFETFVLNCPLFWKRLEIRDKKVSGFGNSYRMEVSF